MGQIIIGSNKYRTEEIASGQSPILPGTDLELEVFNFIQLWHQDDARFEIKTSGSTGKPKTITIAKSLMQQSARMTAKVLDLKHGMQALLAMNPNYIAGKMMIARTLELGLDLHVVEPSSNPLNGLAEDVQIDFAAFVPMQLHQIIKKGYTDKLNSMHSVLVGGGPINKRLQMAIAELETPVYHTYGMTETISHIALKRLNGINSSEHFKILPGFSISNDELGCLIINGGFLEHEVRTKDLVEIIDRDYFKWLGRIDNVINSGGIKLFPEMIEPKILACFSKVEIGDMRMFLGGVPDDRLGQKMILFVEGLVGDKLNALKRLFESEMEEYERPREVIELTRFEETETGKIRRKETINSFLTD